MIAQRPQAQVRSKPPFDPATIPGLHLWLKADAGTLQTSGGSAAVADADPVGQWRDQSAAGNHLNQATASKRPTLKLAIQNGRPVIRFDGVDDFLQALFTRVQPSYIMIAFKASLANQYVCDGALGNTMALYLPSPNVVLYAGSASPQTPYTLGTFVIVEGFFNGAASTISKNGGAAVTGNPGSVVANGFTAGARGDGAAASTVDLAEVVVCNQDPGAPARANLLTYFNSRWSAF